MDKGDRFEQLVKSPEPARQDYECDRVLHEHHFSYEEIAKIEKLVRVNVRFLLQRQLDIQPDGSRGRFRSALVCGFHNAGSASGNNGVAVAPEQCRDGLSPFIGKTSRQGTGGAEHCHSRRNLAEHLEAFDEFSHDAKDPPSILACEIIDDILLFNSASFHGSTSPKNLFDFENSF